MRARAENACIALIARDDVPSCAGARHRVCGAGGRRRTPKVHSTCARADVPVCVVPEPGACSASHELPSRYDAPNTCTGTRTNSPKAYSKNYHFGQQNYVPRRATPTRIASHGAPQARKQAILGDLGRYSTKAASKSPPTKSYSVGLLLGVPVPEPAFLRSDPNTSEISTPNHNP